MLTKLFSYLLILLTSFLSNVSTFNYQKFNDDINNGYYSYYEFANIKEEHYDLIVYKGICNDKPSYGILFNTDTDYILVIEKDETLYSLNKNDEFGYYEALCIEADMDLYLRIYNGNGDSFKIEGLEHSKLNKFSKDTLENTPLFIGLNNCKEFTTLNTYALKIPNYIVIILIISFVIGAAITWLAVMAILKKGKFNEKLRKQLDDDIIKANEMYEETFIVNEEDNDLDNNESSNREESKHYYEDDIEFDINSYLLEHGYKSDYSLFTKEEKEKLTIELMKLKEDKKISEDDYYGEVYKIWK